MTPIAIEVEQLYKSYKHQHVLRGLDLVLNSGICCLLGRNGAGKTTLINLLSGIRRPDNGTIRLFGLNPRLPQSRKVLGATPQITGFPGQLNVREVLEFIRSHYTQPLALQTLLLDFKLEEHAKRQLGGLSPGVQRQVALAAAFAGRPRLVILDEPTVGLDVENRQVIWSFIENYVSYNNVVLFSTHDMSEAEKYGNNTHFLSDGKLVAWQSISGELANLMIVELHGQATFDSKLLEVKSAKRVLNLGGNVKICTSSPEKVLSELITLGLPTNHISTRKVTLEDVILFDLAKG